MKSNKFKISIIGGGPAGASAAFLLASSGIDVCLIEKKDFPREVLCGEFLSKEVTDFLFENDLHDQFLSLNPNRIDKLLLADDSGDQFLTDLGFEGYGLRRSVFDEFLLKKAEEKGAIIFQPAEVKRIIQSEEKVKLIVVQNGEEFEIVSEYCAAAYGKQNYLDKKLGREFAANKSNLNGIKFHISKDDFINYDESTIGIFTGEGIYCGINCVDSGMAALCFLEDRNTIRDVSPRHQILRLADENVFFRELFKPDFSQKINEIPIYGTGNIFFGKKSLVDNNLFFIGDAGRVISPVAGDGIGMALQSAKLFHRIMTANNSNNELPKIKYMEYWEQIFNKRLLSAAVIQRVLLNSKLKFIGNKAVKMFPGLIKYFINSTRSL